MLRVHNLACRRGGSLVFRDTGFAVESGGFVLVTGTNGSGKSSLLRVLAGLIEPSAGTICWNKTDIAEDRAAQRARTHYIGHLDAVKPGLTVCEMLEYWRALRGGETGQQVDILDAFALGKLADRPVRRLSAGQKRRLSLSRLIVQNASLWLLDEPTTALDKAGQDLLRVQIKKHRAKGGIIVAATHDDLQVPDVESVVMTGGATR